MLGEAAAQLSDQFKTAQPSVPWARPSQLRNRIVHGYWSIDDTAVIYVDGVYSSSTSGIVKGSMVRLVPKGSGPKLDLIVVDTIAKLDMSKISAQADGVVIGDGAVEGGPTIEFYPTPAVAPIEKFTTLVGGVAGAVIADQCGDFTCTVMVPELPSGTAAGTTQTIYIKVTDPMGMSTTASLKVYPKIEYRLPETR